jgi:hypothetical protein
MVVLVEAAGLYWFDWETGPRACCWVCPRARALGLFMVLVWECGCDCGRCGRWLWKEGCMECGS